MTDYEAARSSPDAMVNFMHEALHGRAVLPRWKPDEHYSTGLARCVRDGDPEVQRSMRNGALVLLRRFCESGEWEPGYVFELLNFIGGLYDGEEFAEPLMGLAWRFHLYDIPLDVRRHTLNTLVDMQPPRTTQFWTGMAKKDPAYIHQAFSGLLLVDRVNAMRLLHLFSDKEGEANAVILKLDVAYDRAPEPERQWFLSIIKTELPSCQKGLSAAITVWMETKS